MAEEHVSASDRRSRARRQNRTYFQPKITIHGTIEQITLNTGISGVDMPRGTSLE